MTESVKSGKPLFGAPAKGSGLKTNRFVTLRYGESRLCCRETAVSPLPSRFPRVAHVEPQFTLVNQGRPPTYES
jgi:hypothetical protein